MCVAALHAAEFPSDKPLVGANAECLVGGVCIARFVFVCGSEHAHIGPRIAHIYEYMYLPCGI